MAGDPAAGQLRAAANPRGMQVLRGRPLKPDQRARGRPRSVGSMRNVWKGLFLGAVTGAAIGFALDLLYGATREARRRAPEAVDRAAAVTARARKRVRDADIGQRVRALAN